MRDYNVLITTSGRQGLALFTSLPVDVVILDYEMPEMNGDVIAAKMKESKPEVPIMLLSAHDHFSLSLSSRRKKIEIAAPLRATQQGSS